MFVQLSLFDDYTPENCDAVEADSYELPSDSLTDEIRDFCKELDEAVKLSNLNLYRIGQLRKQQEQQWQG